MSCINYRSRRSTIPQQPTPSRHSPPYLRLGNDGRQSNPRDALADPAAQSQATDPFTIITTELVSLVQAALALWACTAQTARKQY